MDRVGAAAHHHVHGAAAGVPICRIGLKSFDLDFLHGVGRGVVGHARVAGRIGGAVDQQLVALVRRAAHREARGPGVVERPREFRIGVRRHAERELRQGQRRPAVDRQVLDGPGVDHLAGARGGGIEHRRFGGNRHRLIHGADFELDVDLLALIRRDANVIVYIAFEAGGLGRDGVGPGRQKRQDVGAVGVALSLGLGAGFRLGSDDFSAGNDRLLLVDDPAAQAAAKLLGKSCKRKNQKGGQQPPAGCDVASLSHLVTTLENRNPLESWGQVYCGR